MHTILFLCLQVWDYIFFTGSVGVGKIVAKAAAPNLTPITLELGGKNPSIIDKTANLKLAAKRIVWGKFINAGQTCIAPDYILIDSTIKKKFYKVLEDEIISAYSKNPQQSADFAHIINEKNFNRLAEMLVDENCIIGGETNIENLYISPIIIDEPTLDSKVMEDEIFGPILPVISFKNLDDIDSIIRRYSKPLSLFLSFSLLAFLRLSLVHVLFSFSAKTMFFSRK